MRIRKQPFENCNITVLSIQHAAWPVAPGDSTVFTFNVKIHVIIVLLF